MDGLPLSYQHNCPECGALVDNGILNSADHWLVCPAIPQVTVNLNHNWTIKDLEDLIADLDVRCREPQPIPFAPSLILLMNGPEIKELERALDNKEVYLLPAGAELCERVTNHIKSFDND